MDIRENLLYSKTHEWILKENGIVKMGISSPAQEKLTDVVFVELPEKGKEYQKGEIIATLESVKSVAEIFAPITGKVIEINEKIIEEPGLINSSPYDDGWLIRMSVENKNELNEMLTPSEYTKILE
jgi:glycine cleavage system H protein